MESKLSNGIFFCFFVFFSLIADKDIRQEKVREEFMNSLRNIDQCGEDIKRLQHQRDGEDINKRTTSFRRRICAFDIPIIRSTHFDIPIVSIIT